MADDAVGPDVAVLTACGRAVVIPVAASALPGGHMPRGVGFFLATQLPASEGGALVPLVCADDAEMVDVDEAFEAMDEEEFCRWMDLRGPGANILPTSSEFIAPKPLPSELHPSRVLGWKDKGVATAVIWGGAAGVRVLCVAWWISLLLLPKPLPFTNYYIPALRLPQSQQLPLIVTRFALGCLQCAQITGGSWLVRLLKNGCPVEVVCSRGEVLTNADVGNGRWNERRLKQGWTVALGYRNGRMVDFCALSLRQAAVVCSDTVNWW